MFRFGALFRIAFVGTVLLLLVWLGIKEGSDGFRNAENGGQRLAGVTQILYGVAALASVWGLLRHRPWLRVALTVWGVAITLTGTLAPVVWGGSGWGSGALGGTLTAVVSILVAWGALSSQRGRG